MANTGDVEAPETPVDLTEELPLDDENVLAPEPPSVWRRYRWPIIGTVVGVVAAAIALPLWLTSGSSTAGGLTITTVTVPVTTGTIQQTVTSSGTIEPASQADLNFAVSGVVTGVNVKAGQTVTAGQVLATVDTTALNEQLNAAEAQLTAAQDKLASDEASERVDESDRLGRVVGHVSRVIALDSADEPQRRVADLDHRRDGRFDRPDGWSTGHGVRLWFGRQHRVERRCGSRRRQWRERGVGVIVEQQFIVDGVRLVLGPDRGDRH